ncbi:MAG: cobalamin B12-binding domain-containing protein [Anaerorhabdus sp.]
MIKVLVTKLGLDGHDVGVKVLTVALRDAGHEVVYLGIRQTPDRVAAVAVDEDVDVVAVSLLSGAHKHHLPLLVEHLRAVGSRAAVVVGGLIPASDVPFLIEQGIAAVVPSGATAAESVAAVETVVPVR